MPRLPAAAIVSLNLFIFTGTLFYIFYSRVQRDLPLPDDLDAFGAVFGGFVHLMCFAAFLAQFKVSAVWRAVVVGTGVLNGSIIAQLALSPDTILLHKAIRSFALSELMIIGHILISAEPQPTDKLAVSKLLAAELNGIRHQLDGIEKKITQM